MVSREKGRTALAVLLLVDSVAGDFVLACDVDAAVVRVFSGLVGLALEVTGGRLGGAEVVAPPKVVRLVVAGVVVVRDDGRFSFSSSLLAASRRADEAVGRVGGLLIVFPVAR